MTTIPPTTLPSSPAEMRAAASHPIARTAALVAALWLQIVAIGLWMGAMIGIGALVAPVAFQVAREQAPQVLGASFARLNTLGLACAGVVLAATLLEAVAGRLGAAAWTRLALVAAAAGIAYYLGWHLFPQMEALRSAAPTTAFDRLHERYEQLGHTQFLLLLGAALATAYDAARARCASGHGPAFKEAV